MHLLSLKNKRLFLFLLLLLLLVNVIIIIIIVIVINIYITPASATRLQRLCTCRNMKNQLVDLRVSA